MSLVKGSYFFGEPLSFGFVEVDEDGAGDVDDVTVPVGVGVGDGVTDGCGAGPFFSAAATAAR